MADGERSAPGLLGSLWVWTRRGVRWLVGALDGLWANVVGAIRPGPTRDTVVAGCVVGYLAIDAARRALDTAVQRIHPAGEDGVGVNSLHDGSQAVLHALDIWERGKERVGSFIRYDPVDIAFVQTLLELILLPFSFALLFGVASHLRTRESTQGDHTAANVMTVAMLGAGLYTVIGAYNQIAELVILGARRPVRGWTDVLEVTGRARGIVLAFTLLPMLTVFIRQIAHARSLPPTWRGIATTFRVMIVAVALHAAILLTSIPGAQFADALRLWELRPSLGFVGVAATGVLAATVAIYAIRTSACAKPTRRVLDRGATGILLAVGVALIGLGLALRLMSSSWWPSIAAAGLITTTVGVLSLPLSSPRADVGTTSAPPMSIARVTVPAVLATAPLVALLIALVRAAVPAMLDRASEVESETDVHLLWWAVLVFVMCLVLYPSLRFAARWAMEHPSPHTTARFRTTGLALFATCGIAAAVIVADPVDRAPLVGVVGILSVFLALLVIAFGGIAIALDGRALPAALDFIGFRKTPVVIGVIVLGVVSQQLASRGYHDIATIDGASRPAASQLSVDEAFDRWLSARTGAADATDAVPLFLVAAAGGGIKAAAFTAAALDCLYVPTGTSPDASCPQTSTWEDVFVASGASGGSVGIASIGAELARPDDDDDDENYDDDSDGGTWVSRTLGDDLLSASAAWQLLVEVPNAVLAFNPSDDRAAVLEASWRRQFDVAADALPYYVDRSAPAWDGPMTFLSGTNLNDGCRVNIAAVRGVRADAPPGSSTVFPRTDSGTCTDRRTVPGGVFDQTDTRDLVDYLCGGANIDLATAAFLSARFPYVSPAGTAQCEPTDPTTDDGTGEIAVGDGGYRDNSGASTIAQLWSIIEPTITAHNESSPTCIVPILVEINSGYAGLDAPDVASTASQFIAPALGVKAVYSDLSFGAIEELAAEFTRPLGPDLEVGLAGQPFTRHLRIALVDHPGVTAPLGWSLSRAAVEDFADQLRVPENRAVIEQVATIVDRPGALTCTRSESG